MASARINYTATSPLGAKIRAYVSAIQEARKNGQELARILDKYLDGEADIAADSGIDVGNVPLVRNLVTQSKNELAEVASTAVGVGAPTGAVNSWTRWANHRGPQR